MKLSFQTTATFWTPMFSEYNWGSNDWHVHSIDFFVLGFFLITSEWDFAHSLTKTCTAAFIPEEFQSRRLNLQSHTFHIAFLATWPWQGRKSSTPFVQNLVATLHVSLACQDQWSCQPADLICFNIYMTHLSYMHQSITLCQMSVSFFENWWGFIMS